MVSIYMKIGKFNNYYVKLFLYVIVASLTSLLSDLHDIKCQKSGEYQTSPVNVSIIVLNVVLQGCIAWRAFIDRTEIINEKDSVENKND